MYFWIHLLLVVLLTSYFLFRFIRDRLFYQLLFLVWVPSTLLTYIPIIGRNSVFRIILGGFQLVMFLLVIFFMFRKKPQGFSDAKEEEERDEEKLTKAFFPADSGKRKEPPSISPLPMENGWGDGEGILSEEKLTEADLAEAGSPKENTGEKDPPAGREV